MMKGKLFHRWIDESPRFLLIWVLLLLTPRALADFNSISIIKSSENSFFNTTIEQLIKMTPKQLKFIFTTAEDLQQNIKLHQPQLFITLGHKAAESIRQLDLDTPVIHSYLTEFQYRKHKLEPKPNHYTLLLDQPLQRYLQFIDSLLSVKKVGIIKMKNNLIAVEKINQIQEKLNIKIDQHLFKPGDNPVNAVRNLLHRNTVLLSLPEPEVYNRQSLKGILLTSYHQNKPVISYSPAHVKSGALAALYSSPADIGNQLAQLLNKMLDDEDFKPENYYYASDFNILINQQVAKSLGLELPETEAVLNALKHSPLP